MLLLEICVTELALQMRLVYYQDVYLLGIDVNTVATL
jgi:hypothetical protein